MTRHYHRYYSEYRDAMNCRYLTSPFRDCIPLCMYGHIVFFLPANKAHVLGHIHSLREWNMWVKDWMCVWCRYGIKRCCDVGHEPGMCACH